MSFLVKSRKKLLKGGFMCNSKLLCIVVFLTFAFFVMVSQVCAQEVEQIGGPYTVDDSTVLLLHFEGNFTNASTLSGDGQPYGSSQFFAVSAQTGLGQCYYLENDAATDSSHLIVADCDALDLYGDWTIEAWFNILTYGTSSEDHRWVPVIMWLSLIHI